MNTQEHIVAVVEPTRDGESTIELAQQVVGRGGRATVAVLMTRETADHIAAFAEVEGLAYPDAREIYLERIADRYASSFGQVRASTVLVGRPDASRVVFDTAAKARATSIAMPQRLANRRGWRSSVTSSAVPVVIVPPRAA